MPCHRKVAMNLSTRNMEHLNKLLTSLNWCKACMRAPPSSMGRWRLAMDSACAAWLLAIPSCEAAIAAAVPDCRAQ